MNFLKKAMHGSKKNIWMLLISFLIAVAFYFGFSFRLDHTLNDYLYQNHGKKAKDIVIIQIDPKAITEFGELQEWGKKPFADAINALSEDKENAPSVIGIHMTLDVERPGEGDELFEKAAKKAGNVVIATHADMNHKNSKGNAIAGQIVVGGEYEIVDYKEPIPGIKEVTKQGHTNIIYDEDGYVRHELLEMTLPDGQIIPSFSRQIYELYVTDVDGLEINTPMIDDNNLWYIPYSGKPGTYSENYSIVDLLNDKIPAEEFKDKIVLIGPYNTTISDYVLTSVDHSEMMYGVEYAANAIDALIDGKFKENVPNVLQMLLLFAFVYISMLWLQNRKLLPSVIYLVLIVMAYYGLCYILYEAGYMLHTMWVPLSLLFTFIIMTGANYTQAALDRARITGTFRKYVAPEVVDEILLNDQQELENGKVMNIAVMFADLRGFTTMAESLTPEETVKLLNEYLDIATEQIMKNGGTLDKYIGDAIMAAWGAPVIQEDFIYKSVKAAQDIIRNSSDKFGIGIHYGKAVIGNIGSKDRMDYTAVGDTVNTAKRLEAIAPPGSVYLSKTVVDALGDRIEVRSLGTEIELKGKKDSIEIFELIF